MDEDRKQDEITRLTEQAEPEGNDDESMYVAIIRQDGGVQDITPFSEEELTTVQETLKSLKAVPKKPRAKRVTPFPAVTSQHVTPLPGTEQFLVLTGSFGPNVAKQPSLWTEGEGFDLTTPTGRLRIQGRTLSENSSLQNYVASELGPEGLKELAGLLDVYDLLTHGESQAQNIEVTAKQVLQRIGKGDHADDNDEQAHLLNTLLYLARTLVIGLSPKQTRVSPLLVLESVTTDEYGTVRIKYHLGEETYDSMYGPRPKLYPLPTPRVIGYHGVRSQHELLLTMFLGNWLAQAEQYSLYFVTLCTHSGLLTREKLLPAEKNRMRDAQRVITALTQLERDVFIRLGPHPDLDLVVAVNVTQDSEKEDTLAPERRERLQPLLRTLEGYKTSELNAKRRAALQRLLDVDASVEERAKENPEFATRLTIFPGAQFVSKQKQLLEKQKEQPRQEK